MTAGRDTAFWTGVPRCPATSGQLCWLVSQGKSPPSPLLWRCLRTAKRHFGPSSIFPLSKFLTSLIVDLKPLFSGQQQSAILGISVLVWWLCCHPITCWSSLRLFLVHIQPMHQPALYLGNQMGLFIESDKNFAVCLGYTGTNIRFVLPVEGHRA